MGTVDAGMGEERENEGWGLGNITGPGWKPRVVGDDIRGLGAMNIPCRKLNMYQVTDRQGCLTFVHALYVSSPCLCYCSDIIALWSSIQQEHWAWIHNSAHYSSPLNEHLSATLCTLHDCLYISIQASRVQMDHHIVPFICTCMPYVALRSMN